MNYGNMKATSREHLIIPLIHTGAFYFIILHMIILISFIYKRRNIILSALPTLLLMYTYLCGPAAIMRYIYPVMIASFLYLGCLVSEIRGDNIQ